MAKAAATSTTDGNKERILEQTELTPRVDQNERGLVALQSKIDSLESALSQTTDMLAHLHTKISYEGIPLPPEIIMYLQEDGKALWLETFRALITAKFASNPVYMTSEKHMQDAMRDVLKGTGILVDALKSMGDMEK
jgi:hypothetical protein